MTPIIDASPDLLEVLLAGYLAEHCRGRQRARTQARIARDLRGLALDVRTRDVQDAVARLRLGGCPVGTGDAGVFLCADRRDWRVAYRNLYGRLRTQARGVRAFRETFRRAVGGQAVFDFAQGTDFYEELVRAPLLTAAALGGAAGRRIWGGQARAGLLCRGQGGEDVGHDAREPKPAGAVGY